jgi:hypothetical protein
VNAEENGVEFVDPYVTILKQTLDTLYNTTTPLGSSATYTGDSTDASGYKQVVGSCFADKDGTLYIEQSSDNTNWDTQSSFSYKASEKFGFSVEIVAKYVRLKYVNGDDAQGTFRLYGWLRVI